MISIKEIEHLADLSKLKVTETDINKLLVEMKEVVDFVRCQDSDNILMENKNVNKSGTIENLRSDFVNNPYDRTDILKNTQNTENGFFVIDKREHIK